MDLTQTIYYDESSVTFLRNKITRNSRALKDEPQGSLYGNGRYTTIQLYGKTYYIHRVIWEIFKGPVPEGMVIDHIDGDKKNNAISNLQCISQKNNVRKGASTKLTYEDITYIRNNYIPYSREFGTRGLSRKFGVNHTTIQAILDNTTWN